jgi:hypothetical protein
MKRMIWIGIAASMMGASAHAFDAKEDVKAAAKKLAEAANYSWTGTTKNNADGGGQGQNRFAPGPVEGKVEKDGFTWFSMKVGENGFEALLKGEKFAVKSADGWKGSAELQPGQGGGQGRPDPAMFLARSIKTMKAPADGVVQALDRVKELKSEGDGVYSGELTEEGAKETVLPTRPGGQAGQAPQVNDAKGSIKVWVKDGMISKIESTVSGKMTIRDQERAINRTTTVEIKDVGSTKIEIPEEAKKKLE